MNITVQNTHNICPFIIAISKALSMVGHRVVFWNQDQKSIYEMFAELQPDITIVTDQLKPNYWQVLQDKNYILYGTYDPMNKAIARITKTELIDLLSYPNTFEDYSLNTDVLFSTNYYHDDRDFTRVADRIFEKTDLRIKCCGHRYMQSPYFVGVLETEDFTKVALSSKIVITTDEIEKASLLNRKIYAVLPEELSIEDIEAVCKNEKLRKSKLKEARKDIPNKNSVEFSAELLETIGLNHDKEKSLSLLGNLL